MQWDEFSEWGRKISEWASDYHQNIRALPVRAQTAPGAIKAQLSASPPEISEDMTTIMGDFERIVMPGMTHWQHPRFFAYFPANAAPPSSWRKCWFLPLRRSACFGKHLLQPQRWNR